MHCAVAQRPRSRLCIVRIRVFHFSLFFSDCLSSIGFPLFHLFNKIWWQLFDFKLDSKRRDNSPKFSIFVPFGVEVTHVRAIASRALTPRKYGRARGGINRYFMTL